MLSRLSNFSRIRCGQLLHELVYAGLLVTLTNSISWGQGWSVNQTSSSLANSWIQQTGLNPPLFTDPKPLTASMGVAASESASQANGVLGANGGIFVPGQVDPNPLSGTAPAFNSNGMAGQGAFPSLSQCQPNCPCHRMSLSPCEAACQSLFGDVYAPGSWRPLELEDFFSDGWDEAWAGGPAGGEGLTPRHGWLGANDGVFYRLWLNTFSYVSQVPIGNGLHANSYSSTFSIFLPLNRRMEILIDIPYLVSGSTSTLTGGMPTANSTTQFGDLVITPRFLLQESQRISQVLAMGVETPTGSVTLPSSGQTSLTPRYEFWSNPAGAWVVRGGVGVYVPIDNVVVPTSFTGNVGVGRYLTSHDAPLGDLVLYGATNVVSPFVGGPSTVSIGPGTRFHVGHNWFVLGFANFYLTTPAPGSYLTQVALMKVF